MATSTRRWRDLSTSERAAIVAGAAVQFGLLSAALTDLARRRPEEVNGPKRLWVGISFINFVGPLAYFLFGRRKAGAARAGELSGG
ncbi:MAG TPA: PLD nuclease N-terminal domain-containing protein [Nakamurella sp.]